MGKHQKFLRLSIGQGYEFNRTNDNFTYNPSLDNSTGIYNNAIYYCNSNHNGGVYLFTYNSSLMALKRKSENAASLTALNFDDDEIYSVNGKSITISFDRETSYYEEQYYNGEYTLIEDFQNLIE